jgi:hypothetical protein
VLSDVVGTRIAALRKTSGDITREELAQRCVDLGWPVSVAVLTNMETGRRKGAQSRREITVDEVVVLARALEVPPLILLFPVGTERDTEIGLDTVAPTWAAVRWFVGEAALDGGPIDDEPGAAPLMLYRQHEQIVDDLNDARIRGFLAGRDAFTGTGVENGVAMYEVRHGRPTSDAAETAVAAGLAADQDARARYELAQERLGKVRSEMRRLRLLIPDLPTGAGLEVGSDG